MDQFSREKLWHSSNVMGLWCRRWAALQRPAEAAEASFHLPVSYAEDDGWKHAALQLCCSWSCSPRLFFSLPVLCKSGVRLQGSTPTTRTRTFLRPLPPSHLASNDWSFAASQSCHFWPICDSDMLICAPFREDAPPPPTSPTLRFSSAHESAPLQSW